MADKELLSALTDGETVDKALIAELEQDLESQKTWQNYHLIGDIMRGESPEAANWNIAESVAAALENEPAYTQVSHLQQEAEPIQKAVLDQETVPMVESQPMPQQARRQLPAWLTQFGQVAVAACVSLAVIVGVQQYGGSDPTQPQAEQLPVLQTIPLAGSVEPVSLTRKPVKPLTEQANEAEMREKQRSRINALLQDFELQLRLNAEAVVQEVDNPEPVVE